MKKQAHYTPDTPIKASAQAAGYLRVALFQLKPVISKPLLAWRCFCLLFISFSQRLIMDGRNNPNSLCYDSNFV